MTKILIVGDQHHRGDLPYSSGIKDGRKSEWEAVKKTIHDTAKGCDSVVLLGDNLNARNNASSVLKDFIEFLKGFGDKELHILCGNHERSGTSTALDFLKKIDHPQWHVYTEPTQAKVADMEAMMIPYMTSALMGAETLPEATQAVVDLFPTSAWPLAFAHHAIGGASFNGIPVESFKEIILPQKEMEAHFSHTFAGHIHTKQHIFPSIYMTGCVPTQEVGEHEKSIWVYESDGTINVSVTEIKLPVRGIYKVIFANNIAFNDLIDIPSGSIVKAIITSREVMLDQVEDALKRFDSYMIVEQYPSERAKTHFEDGALDLSVDNLLKLYGEAKGISVSDLMEGFNLISK